MDSTLTTVRRGYGFLWITMVLLLPFIGDAESAGLIPEKTPGEKFREAIKIMENNCAARKNVPAADASCDFLKLKPYDALSTPEGRIAHAIRLPPPHNKPKTVYRKGMTSEEYFKALCDAEAGEFIFETKDNVEGLYQMRPRSKVTDDELRHLYAVEDPYGYTPWEAADPGTLFVWSTRYKYLEVPITQATPNSIEKYRRLSGYREREGRGMVEALVSERSSDYGFTWRGIERPNDREHGIAGGELIVMDLRNNKVLAVRRGFIRTGSVRNEATGVWWPIGQVCPRYGFRGGRDKDIDFAYWFIGRVLKPVRFADSFRELQGAK